MSALRYRLYPSLLDKFQRFLDADKDFEDFGNVDGEGNYKRSLEEIQGEREKELLDAINRVPHAPIEAADRGTCFNALIDYSANGIFTPGLEISSRFCKNNYNTYTAKMNGFEFVFNAHDVDVYAKDYVGATSQYLCKGILPTKYGDVQLYGYADEIIRDRVVDIKTTTRYNFGKFEHGWQKEVYPYCLVASGDMTGVTAFDYDVYILSARVGEPFFAQRYRETYDYNHKKTTCKLTAFVETFIEWLELHKMEIADEKIFA